MSEDFWGGFGVKAEDVSENPFLVSKKDTYTCVIAESKVTTFKKDPTVPYWIIQLDVAEGPDQGKSGRIMHRLIPWKPEERAGKGKDGSNDYESLNARLLSNIKKQLVDLGLEAEQIAAFNPHIHASAFNNMRVLAFLTPNSQSGFNEVGSVIKEPDVSVAPTASDLDKVQESPESAEATNQLLSGW